MDATTKKKIDALLTAANAETAVEKEALHLDITRTTTKIDALNTTFEQQAKDMDEMRVALVADELARIKAARARLAIIGEPTEATEDEALLMTGHNSSKAKADDK